MPHGAGHHGGGGGGGGHHGGGGFGGGHHHHHGGGHHHGGFRHHHRHTTVGYYGYGPHLHYYRRRPITWVIFGIVAIVMIVVLSTISVRYTAGGYSDDDGLDYAPTDTRIVPVSNSFCQNLKLTVDSTSDPGYTATLYMLNAPPMLTGKESFSFSVTPYIIPDNYKYYYFYMYPGSSFTMSACIGTLATSPSTFILIKGNNRFSQWKDGQSVPKEHHFSITTLCSSGETDNGSYRVSHEDNYFLIFDNTDYSSSQLQVDFTFVRTRYELSNSTIAEKCDTTTTDFLSPCSVSVPLSSQTAFLTIVPTDSDSAIDWTDGITLDIACQPRVWMYFVVSLSIFAGVVAIVVPLLVCVCVYLRKSKQTSTNASTATTTTTTTAAATVTTDSTPLITTPSPPPVNPKFEQDLPAYDAGYPAPPAYKP